MSGGRPGPSPRRAAVLGLVVLAAACAPSGPTLASLDALTLAKAAVLVPED